ncbi:MAG: transglutaminase domain-containing protein [Candidatus Hydrogenedentes bacterium]|nr:transglutaminase domain-containing protein [Candidatus Hydrogenedentota bacterium]
MDYYAVQGPFSDPGRHADSYDDLPDDVASICAVVQNLCIHVLHGVKYGVELPEHRFSEVHLYPVEEMLTRILELDPRPLAISRDPARRIVANCRHYAILLCSMLRHKGIPARLRCGFETYLHRRRFGDHWLCEYWSAAEERWVLIDPELDSVHCQTFRVAFDPLDLPPDTFFVAGEMWRRCRDGRADPKRCGFLDRWGLWYVRDNVIRDALCLNKVELHPWDRTGLTCDQGTELSDADVALTDRLAELTWPWVDRNALGRFYQEYPALREVRPFFGELSLPIGR